MSKETYSSVHNTDDNKYNDSVYNTLPIESDIVWYKLIYHC